MRWFLPVATTLLACTGDVPTEPVDTDPSVTVDTVVVDTEVDTEPEPFNWTSLSRQDKIAYMSSTVVPVMGALFEAYDSERFASFSCTTCHGDDMVAAHYQLPNDLFRLDPSALPYSSSADPTEAAWGTFMETQVLPTMAELLGTDAVDAGGDGLSCFDCHRG